MTAATLNPDILAANLAAMARWTTAAAGLVAGASIPADWQLTPGSDGALTFARRLGDRSIEWLGGTSMPRASAAPLMATIDPAQHGGNALGLGIGTGFEWRTLCGRLARHQMLFVLETDLTAARLALSICDVAALVSSAKLVLLVGEQPEAVEAQLLSFLAANHGVDPPSVMHALGTLSAERRNMLLSLGERIIRRAIGERSAQFDALATQLASFGEPWQAGVRASAALALTLTPAHAYDRVLPHVLAACPDMPRLALDHHTTASNLVRLQTILTHRPGHILSDLFRPQLALALPATPAIHTFIPPAPAPAYWQRLAAASTLAPDDRIVCHAAYHRELLIAHGYATRQVVLMPLAVAAPTTDKRPSASENATVALIADLANLDAEANGMSLPSHAALWAAAREIIAESPLAMHPGLLPDVLRRAQARVRIPITDAALADTFLMLLRHVLLPAAARIALAQALAAGGIPLQLVGVGWQQANLAVPAAPLSAPDIFAHVGIALHFDPAGVVHPAVLAAPFHGAAIVSPQQPWHADVIKYPATLPTLLCGNTDFLAPTPGQLIATLKSLLRSPDERQALASAAAGHLRAHHTWAQRCAQFGWS